MEEKLLSPLWKRLTEDFYRNNAFRQTGLPVDATDREILRFKQTFRMKQKYAGQDGEVTILPVQPAPSEEELGEAIRQLQDPLLRMLHAFFWFWPLNWSAGEPDPMLELLRQGNAKQAREGWKKMVDSQNHPVAQHNLAVYFHCVSLDQEWQILSGEKEDKGHELTISWRKAHSYWGDVIESEAFWDTFSEQAALLDDPRVGEELKGKLRENLPTVLLLLQVHLSKLYSAQSQETGLSRQQGLLQWRQPRGRKSPPSIEKEAYSAIVEETRSAISEVQIMVPQRVDPWGGLLARVKRLQENLNSLDAILPESEPLRRELHDEGAAVVMQKVGKMGRSLPFSTPMLEIAEIAGKMACDQVVRNKAKDLVTYLKIKLGITDLNQLSASEILWLADSVSDPGLSRSLRKLGRSQRVGNIGCLLALLLGFAGCGITKSVVPEGSQWPGYVFFLVLMGVFGIESLVRAWLKKKR